MAAKVQGTKNRRAMQMQDDAVLASVKDLNLDSVSKSIAETQVEIQKVLADLSAKVLDRLQDLENVENSIRLKKEVLKQLHDIEYQATTLDELEANIKDQRRTWEEEQATKQREFKEMQSERNKAWKREEEEYQYRISQEHMKEKDSLATLMGQQTKANKEKQEQLEKIWNERESELKKREQELLDLRKFKEEDPERIKKEVNASVAVATNSLKKEYETKMVLAAKDSETDKRLADQTIASMTQSLTKMQGQFDDLNAKLEQAQKDVKEISAKALESASGRATTDALQRIMEKEQGSGKQTK
jgi:colicin import membrane protein